jgi:ribosomal small subunit protein bTHX
VLVAGVGSALATGSGEVAGQGWGAGASTEVMGRGDTRTRRGKIKAGSNGKCRPRPDERDKFKSWMNVDPMLKNPLIPEYKRPIPPTQDEILQL